MNTSLQNIITRENSSLHDSEVRMLFQKKEYRRFELLQFHKNNELIKREKFLFFLKILQSWNEAVQRRESSLNDCTFVKNEFIFSWLKSLAVQNSQHIDSSLQELYNWYNSTKAPEPVCFIKREINNKSHLEEWEIRNSYKSNLPLEIDTYKRRFIINPQKENLEQLASLSRTAQNSPIPSIFKDNSLSKLKQHNSLLKQNREDEEVKSYLKDYKNNKVYFYKNMAKNYYRQQFERDKLATISNFYKPKKNLVIATDEIKSYRIKTTMGSRPFQSGTKALNHTSYSGLFRPQTNGSTLNNECNNGFEQNEIIPPISNINEIGLITNPFEVKLRKKKK